MCMYTRHKIFILGCVLHVSMQIYIYIFFVTVAKKDLAKTLFLETSCFCLWLESIAFRHSNIVDDRGLWWYWQLLTSQPLSPNYLCGKLMILLAILTTLIKKPLSLMEKTTNHTARLSIKMLSIMLPYSDSRRGLLTPEFLNCLCRNRCWCALLEKKFFPLEG